MTVQTLSPMTWVELRPRVRPDTRASTPRPARTPPLRAGDHLTRVEFEQIYEAHPEIKLAELIEGVVYMPSPTRFEEHSRPHADIITWLNIYRTTTPGVGVGDNATVRLDYENEIQPDAVLRLDSGGHTRLTADGYLFGPPELIVEVAASSAAYDLHVKRRVYQRAGVQEYLALQVYEQRVDWWALREGVYQPLLADEQGIFRSDQFPGLWLNAPALWADDLAAVLATLQAGMTTPEHAEFAARLAEQTSG